MNNGLKSEHIKSQTELIKNLKEDNLLSFLKEKISKPSYAIMYFYDSVVTSKWTEGNFYYFDKDIQAESGLSDERFPDLKTIRIFNPESEIFLNRMGSSKEFSGRSRVDQTGEKSEEVVKINQILFGSRTEETSNENYTILRENRGTEIILPFSLRSIGKNERIAVQMNYYIKYNELNVAGYYDSRMIDFVLLNKRKEEEIENGRR
ncbi:MAG: hypothetical protein KDK54_13200 [Leptospiraceae bacterium]|nr:hypothetical protein [Leptospiraceae bacterium]